MGTLTRLVSVHPCHTMILRYKVGKKGAPMHLLVFGGIQCLEFYLTAAAKQNLQELCAVNTCQRWGNEKALRSHQIARLCSASRPEPGDTTVKGSRNAIRLSSSKPASGDVVVETGG